MLGSVVLWYTRFTTVDYDRTPETRHRSQARLASRRTNSKGLS
jgi:hypothetical protein